MKTITLFLAGTLFTFSTVFGVDNEEKAVKEAVKLFSQSADLQNTNNMNKVLHKNFRAVLNQLFGSKEVSITDKETYLALLKDKKIGGDKRKVSFESVDIYGKNASVKAVFDGNALKFSTYILLVKTAEGKWQVINDMPIISKK